MEVWRSYRGRADCENRIKELKADFGLDSFVLRDFWANKAGLGVTMLAHNLMSVFRHAVMRQNVHHTLATLHTRCWRLGQCGMAVQVSAADLRFDWLWRESEGLGLRACGPMRAGQSRSPLSRKKSNGQSRFKAVASAIAKTSK